MVNSPYNEFYGAWWRVAALLAALGLCAVVHAQPYPTRPIRLIVPSPAGGGMDTLARAVGQPLTERWGQQVVVDPRPGATGIIGTDLAAKAAPDGYTLLLAWVAPLAINPALYPKLPYDMGKDFAPIMVVATTPNMIVVAPSSPVVTVKDLIALARAKPGQLTYASSGIGGSSHLAGELFRGLTGVDMVHVPYKGTPPALIDLIAGRISLMFAAAAPALPHVSAKKLRAVAITTAKRSPNLPDLPAVAETVPGFDAETWYGLLAPAGTSPRIVASLQSEIARYFRNPDVSRRLAEQGFDVVAGTPEEFSRYLQSEIRKWRKVIQTAGIKPE